MMGVEAEACLCRASKLWSILDGVCVLLHYLSQCIVLIDRRCSAKNVDVRIRLATVSKYAARLVQENNKVRVNA